jgi:hypothetical protein
MTIAANLRLTFPCGEDAERIALALAPDNEGYISVQVCKNVITAKVTSATSRSLRHTLDDFLACLSLAERTGEVLK